MGRIVVIEPVRLLIAHPITAGDVAVGSGLEIGQDRGP
jgi:hypothetical protein